MKIEQWPIDRPTPYKRNARQITQVAVDKVAASLKEFGWNQPICVDKSGVIVAGHTRLLAAQKLGLKVVPVYVASDLSESQIRAYRIMDNRSHEENRWSNDVLALEIQDLNLSSFDLELTGFNASQLGDLLIGFDEPEIAAPSSSQQHSTPFDAPQNSAKTESAQGNSTAPPAPASSADAVQAPTEFKSFDESIPTDHQCPKCGYAWSGKTA